MILLIGVLGRRPAVVFDAAACAGLALLVLLIARDAPVAVGRSDTPEFDRVRAGELRVDGWVLAPRGAQAVEMRALGRVLATVPVKAAPAVASMFPIDGGSATFTFEIRIDVAAGAPQTFELWVVAADDSRQRFDRRRIEVVP